MVLTWPLIWEAARSPRAVRMAATRHTLPPTTRWSRFSIARSTSISRACSCATSAKAAHSRSTKCSRSRAAAPWKKKHIMALHRSMQKSRRRATK